MIFNRRSKVVVDCFTTDPFVYEDAKISPAVRFYPDWWKEVPKTNEGWELNFLKTNDPNELAGRNTMKACIGFMEFYKYSFAVPSWTEFRLHIASEASLKNGASPYSYSFADKKSSAGDHSTYDHNNTFKLENYQHLKIFSPWEMSSNVSVKWLVVAPSWHIWNNFDPVNVVPGVLDFYYQSSTNIHFLIKRSKQEELFFEFPFGMPLCQMFPLTEKKIELRHHLVTENEREIELAKRGAMTKRYFGANFSKHRQWRNKS